MKIIMKQSKLIWSGIIVFLLFTGLNAFAQGDTSKATKVDSVVVTATRTETPSEFIANAVTIVTAEEIELKGYNTVYDVLKDVPGLALTQSGGPGQWTSVRMRGGQDKHIKLLINGSAVGDQATGITPHYDLWNMLNTDDIERIEVIRGAQSALYGSDAVSGVINIITKKGKGKPKFFLKGMGGSMETWRMSGGMSGSEGNLRYNLTASHRESGGVQPDNEFKDDSVTTNLGYQFSENVDLSLFLKYSDTWVNGSQSDSKKWKVYNDPNSYRYGHLFFSSLEFSQKLTSFWDHKITLGYDRIEKKHHDPDDGILDIGDNIRDSAKQAEYESTTKKAYWQNNFSIGENDKLTAGAEYEDAEMDRDHRTATRRKCYGDSIDTKAFYLQNQLFLLEDKLAFIIGGRLDDHSSFGSHFTYSMGVSYLIEQTGTRLKASYGTGFCPPSIFELFDPQYGNSKLDPEESENWEVGFEQNLFGGKAVLKSVYFHNDFENLIAYDYGVERYQNRETAESYGVESSLSIFPFEHMSFTMSYTYTDGEENGTDLAKVPKDDFKFGINYFPGRFRISASLYYVGDRLASDQKEEHRMDAYTLVNLAGSYKITEDITMFVQLDNIFDENYYSSAPYEAPGFCAFVELKITFPFK